MTSTPTTTVRTDITIATRPWEGSPVATMITMITMIVVIITVSVRHTRVASRSGVSLLGGPGPRPDGISRLLGHGVLQHHELLEPLHLCRGAGGGLRYLELEPASDLRHGQPVHHEA